MVGVNVKYYPYSWDNEERTYSALLITVERVDGEWVAVIYVDGKIRKVNATELVEWEV